MIVLVALVVFAVVAIRAACLDIDDNIKRLRGSDVELSSSGAGLGGCSGGAGGESSAARSSSTGTAITPVAENGAERRGVADGALVAGSRRVS